MVARNRKVYLTALLGFLSQVSLSFCEDVPSIWNEFWSVSCKFSTIATRSRRSVPEEPDLNNPTELFNYLYPLADVKLEDFLQDEKRSSSTHSISTWLEDLVDLWQSECDSRDSSVRRKKRASSPTSPPSNDETEDEEDVNDDENETTESVKEGNVTVTRKDEKPEKLSVADSNTFFPQYGGDIEYFFPVIGFGIPFDGEITFLGFHGFKGIFPY